MKIHILVPPLGLAAAFILLASPQASAQIKTWDGGGANGNWQTGDNWDLNTPPAAGNTLIFAGSAGTAATNNFAANTVFNLRFDAAASPFTLSGATIALGSANDANGNIRFTGALASPITQTITANLDLSSGGGGGRTISVVPDGTISISGNIAGTLGLTKAGGGTLALSGVNSFSGPAMNISGGTVQFSTIGNSNASSAAGAVPLLRIGSLNTTATIVLAGSSSAQSTDKIIVVGDAQIAATSGGAIIRNDNANAAHSLTFSGATFNGNQPTITLARTVTFGGVNTGSNTVAGIISNNNTGTGTIAVTKADAGTWILSGANLYTGGTTISGGMLQFAKTNAMPVTGAVAVGTGTTLAVNAGGAGEFTSATSGAGSIGGLLSGVGGQGAAVNYSGNVTLGIDTTGGNVTYAGSMANVGTTLSLQKLGSLRLTLNGNNTFTGATTVGGTGTLDLARVGGQSLGSTTSVTVNSGATLLLSQSDQVNDAATVTLSGGTIRNTNAGGIGETFGNLNLTADSFLDFGNGLGNNVMNFGTYAGGGFKLTVQDFAAGNVLTFKTDLTSTINNTSLFDFSNAFTSGWNSGTSTFTITAIPEPSTYVAALGLAGLMLWPLRRRVVGRARLRFR